MNQKPITKEEILKELDYYQSKDQKYSDGRILGSMCTYADPFAEEVFCKFLYSNLGDPGLFKGTKTLENKVIRTIGSFLSEENVHGHIVTGGTEANIMAMRAARNYAVKEKKIKNGEIIIPKSAHFSFKKAEDMLGLKIIEVDLTEEYKIDINSLKENISHNTIAIVAIAGTTELGMIDPIDEISKIAYNNDIYLHVDAAFGSFSIPFLKDLGYNFPEFDFSLPGVCSITADPHKMGLAPIPAGCILFRDKKYLDVMSIKAPYLTSKEQSTIVGTRLGASAPATYAVMKYIGREGYSALADIAMKNTYFLGEELKKEGYILVVEPELNILAFNHPTISTDLLAKKIKEKGWEISISSCPRAIRIILMRHITKDHIIEFLEDLKEINNSFKES